MAPPPGFDTKPLGRKTSPTTRRIAAVIMHGKLFQGRALDALIAAIAANVPARERLGAVRPESPIGWPISAGRGLTRGNRRPVRVSPRE
jgi:hypothetical protein